MRSGSRRAIMFALVPVLVAGCTAYRRAGTGDVAFRLVWDGTSDLDLLLEVPRGSCIYWGQRESPLGGILDVDCNAGTDRLCGHPIEYVFWPSATPVPSEHKPAWMQQPSSGPSPQP